MPGQRQSLRTELTAATPRLRPEFLRWLERQRVANNDSLQWWMTSIAGRNNLVSQFFASLCQIVALRTWLAQSTANEDLLVVCEDAFTLAAARENLSESVHVRTSVTASFWFAGDTARLVWRAARVLLSEVARHWRLRRVARRTRSGSPTLPDGEVVLVHQCLDDAAFQASSRITCRYFTILPEWLERAGRRVVRLPWLANVTLPLDVVYRRLRADGALVIEDWLTPSDYLGALRNEVRAAFTLRHDIAFVGFRLESLIRRERLRQLGAGNGHFWLHETALRNWGARLSRCVVITHFEGMVPEHVPVYAARKTLAGSTALGYMHSLASRDFLAYHFDPHEWSSSLLPTRVVTSGPLGKEMLVRQGAPPARIVVGPALRQAHPVVASSQSRTSLLLLLPLLDEASVELLDKVSKHAEWITSYLKVPVRVKSHPMAKRERLTAELGWARLPAGWEWVEHDLYESLAASRCCITVATASALDAVLAGCIVLPLTRELDSSWNNLDVFEDEFPMVGAVSERDIPARLAAIFCDERDRYDTQFAAIRARLAEGLNPVDDTTLSAFLT